MLCSTVCVCVCELKPSVLESGKLVRNLVRNLISVTENGEADVISAGCTKKTEKAKVHSFTLIKHVSVFQILKDQSLQFDSDTKKLASFNFWEMRTGH